MKIKYMIFVFFIMLTYPVFAQDLSLKEADTFYNNDYSNALTNTQKYSPLKNITNSLFSFAKNNIIIFLIIALLIIILSQIFSKKTDCIVIWGWWDLIPVAIAGIIFVYYLYASYNEIKYDSIANVIYFSCVLITFIFSLIGNIKYSGSKWPFFLIISILTKIIIMIIIPIILVLLIFTYLYGGKKDGRFRDGTRDNDKTFILGILSVIFLFLIGSLIKTGKENYEQE